MSVPQSPFPVVNPDEAASTSSASLPLGEAQHQSSADGGTNTGEAQHTSNGNGTGVARFKCLRFSPDDDEIITDFLEPKIQKQDMAFSLIRIGDIGHILSGTAGSWTASKYPFFPKSHYWFFVVREPAVNTGSNLIPQRLIGYDGNFFGSWRDEESTPISKGGEVIGFKTKLVFFTNDDQKTGWLQYEYCRNSQAFEEMVVSHLIYDENLTFFCW